MTELVKQTLEDYFSDYKDYHLIILIAFAVVIALIQIIQSIIITKKIESFKTVLKKSEIKFSRYNELQINALRRIYHQLDDLQNANVLLFNTNIGTIGHDNLKIRINNWLKAYFVNSNEFSKEKILLTPDLKELYSKTITDFETVRKTMIFEKSNLELWEMMNEGDWKEMYEYEENEIDVILAKIGNLKELKSMKNSEKNIEELRKKIEEIFLTMN
jgi:hypothetical protein